MSNVPLYKLLTLSSFAAIGTLISGAFGGWDASLQTLCIFMAIDYVSGIIIALMKKSDKTQTGGLSSAIGFKGIAKKVMILLFVLVGARLDLLMSTHYLRDGVCIAFIANELISIVENAGIIGLPVPKLITDVIDILKKKSDNKDGDKS